MSNLKTHYYLKLDFQKKWTNIQEASGNSTAPNTARTLSCKAYNFPVEYLSRESKHDIKGSEGNMFNTNSKGTSRDKNVQGGAHLQNLTTLYRKSKRVFQNKNMAIKIPFTVRSVMMKQKSINELVKGTHNDTQHQNKTHPKPSPIDCDGVQLTNAQCHMVPISILWYSWRIWRYLTFKIHARYILSCVSKINSVQSIIFHVIYGAVCIQLTNFFNNDCDNMFTLCYHHHHLIGSMTLLSLLKVRSWNNAMRYMSLYILLNTFCLVSVCYFGNIHAILISMLKCFHNILWALRNYTFVISNVLFQRLISWAFPVKSPSREYQRTTLMIDSIGSSNGLVPG